MLCGKSLLPAEQFVERGRRHLGLQEPMAFGVGLNRLDERGAEAYRVGRNKFLVVLGHLLEGLVFRPRLASALMVGSIWWTSRRVGSNAATSWMEGIRVLTRSSKGTGARHGPAAQGRV